MTIAKTQQAHFRPRSRFHCSLGNECLPHLAPLPSDGTHGASVHRRGLSLIEVVASTLIVGVMAVAALNALGAATRSANTTGNRAVALGLADELMAEILQVPYREPYATPVFGPEPDEVGGPRDVFNDVDDYHGWLELPPQASDGTPLPDRDGWRRWVEVYYVTPENLAQTTGPLGDQGAKRIRVVVEYHGEVLAEQHGLRTDW